MNLEKNNFIKFKDKYSITPIFFESAVTNKKVYLSKLETISNKTPSTETEEICERERIPRQLSKIDYERKLNNLFSKISVKYTNLLNVLIKEYENDFFSNEGFHFSSILK